MNFTIRKIEKGDNNSISTIIRSSLEEFGANNPGTVYFDDSTDHLFELFLTPKSIYYIAEKDGIILGGGGIFPTEGLPTDTCELVKMYIIPEARKMGIGSSLINKCMDKARSLGFKRMYLETMPGLVDAIKIYKKFNFIFLNQPLGNTGHHGCSIWMIRELLWSSFNDFVYRAK